MFYLDFEILNTCGDLNIAKWRLLHALSNYTHTSNLHIFLASTLNPLLQPSVSNLGLEFSQVQYVSPHSTLTTLSRLVRQMGWKQVRRYFKGTVSEIKVTLKAKNPMPESQHLKPSSHVENDVLFLSLKMFTSDNFALFSSSRNAKVTFVIEKPHSQLSK